jgi:hypothetical protein
MREFGLVNMHSFLWFKYTVPAWVNQSDAHVATFKAIETGLKRLAINSCLPKYLQYNTKITYKYGESDNVCILRQNRCKNVPLYNELVLQYL